MAASDVGPWPIKNKAFRAHFLLLDADGDPVTGATALDTEVSKDGGSFVDATNEGVEIGNGWYYTELTSAEMNADTVLLVLKTGTAGAKTAHLMIHPVAIDELSGVPAFGAGGAGIEETLSWLLALSRNLMTQSATTTTLKKNDGTTTLATATVSDDGTTFTRAKFV